MKALVVGTIFSGLGGGSDVNYEVLKTLPQLGIDVTLYVPTFYVHRAVLAYLKGSSIAFLISAMQDKSHMVA